MRFNFWQKNLGRSYWQTGVIPALVSFFLVSGPIFSTWACFWVPRPSDGKKPITYSDTEFYSESSGKNFFQKFPGTKKLVRPQKGSLSTFWLLIGNPYFVLYI